MLGHYDGDNIVIMSGSQFHFFVQAKTVSRWWNYKILCVRLELMWRVTLMWLLAVIFTQSERGEYCLTSLNSRESRLRQGSLLNVWVTFTFHILCYIQLYYIILIICSWLIFDLSLMTQTHVKLLLSPWSAIYFCSLDIQTQHNLSSGWQELCP